MLKVLKPLIISSFVLVLSFVVLQLTTPLASAAAPSATPSTGAVTGDDVVQGGLCKGGNDLAFNSGNAIAGTGECTATNSSASSLNSLVKNIINIFSIVVGIVAVIMIIIGGFRYITSGGDSGNVTTAKNTILYAIIGLVIVALAQFIVRFVLNKSTGLT